MHRHLRLAGVLVFLTLLWALVQFSGLREHFSIQVLHDAFVHHRVAGLVLFAGLFAIGNLAQIPGVLFLAAAVLALGEWWGGAVTYLAACLSCAATFCVVRLVGADALRRVGGRLGTALFARMDAHPVRSVFWLRMLLQTAPTLNYALALSGIGFTDYMLGTVLGLPLPIMVYSVFFDSLARWLGWPAVVALPA